MAAGVLALLVPAAALADGISGYVEEGVVTSRTDDTDAAGATQRVDTTQFIQRYRLALDRAFLPTWRVAAGGLFERTIGTRGDGTTGTNIAGRNWSAFGNLLYTLPTLNLGAGYNRRESYPFGPVGVVNEEYSIVGNWRPEALPVFSLRLSRPSVYDTNRADRDIRSYDGLLSMSWSPVRSVDLGYSVAYSNPRDEVRGSETVTWLQTARASYSDQFLDGRSTVGLSGTATRRINEIRSAGAGGTIAVLQSPIAGYGLVETGVATRERDTLTPNPGLINGDVTASAGIDLGFSRSLAGDSNYRDIGAQLADTVTPVNTLYVWVDRELPPQVAQALLFEAWKSDDNVQWTQTAVLKQFFAEQVSLQNRFEITIADTPSRFFKVVTRPLSPAVTTDPLFANIFVTELQLLLVQPLPTSRHAETSNSGVFSASVRTVLAPSIGFAHDVSLFVSSQQRPEQPAATVWVLLNGLSASRQLTEILLVSARAARQDADQLRGHEGAFLFGASVAATPLPTLSYTLVYSGQLNQTQQGDTSSNSVTLLNQATPYPGIGVLAAVSYNVATNLAGQTSRTDTATVTSTLQPHPKLTLAASFAHSATISEGGGLPRASNAANRIEGTVTFVPVRALFASVTVTRVVQEPRPATFGNAALGFNPFPGGDLQLGASYNETLDADSTRTRVFGPFVRWNIRRGTVLNVNYSVVETDRQALGSQHTQTFGANLSIPL